MLDVKHFFVIFFYEAQKIDFIDNKARQAFTRKIFFNIERLLILKFKINTFKTIIKNPIKSIVAFLPHNRLDFMLFQTIL
jgi:hypothetical protein